MAKRRVVRSTRHDDERAEDPDDELTEGADGEFAEDADGEPAEDTDEPAEDADDELAEDADDELTEDADGQARAADEDGADDEDGGARRRRSRRRRDGDLTAARAGRIGLRQIAELTGKEPEGVTGVEPGDDGWIVGVEVVEDRRIPSSTDILATYETEVDMSGELVSYRRVKRYPRGRGDSEDA